MRLDRSWIERHIPHHGRMCLLDEIVSWNPEGIHCRTGTHRDAANPMRAHGRLGIACGIEYAAQAMAVHGALVAGAAVQAAVVGGTLDAPPTAGFLAALRGVEFRVQRLDDLVDDLACDAVRVAGDGRGALYDFELRCAGVQLMSGRATVVLDSKPG